jgi:antitoxin HicB
VVAPFTTSLRAGCGRMKIEEAAMKRQEHVREVEEVAIRIRVEALPPASGGGSSKEGRYLGTSPDVPGLVAEGRSIAETIEIAQGLARKIVESCREHGDPLPAVFSKSRQKTREFLVLVPI